MADGSMVSGVLKGLMVPAFLLVVASTVFAQPLLTTCDDWCKLEPGYSSGYCATVSNASKIAVTPWGYDNIGAVLWSLGYSHTNIGLDALDYLSQLTPYDAVFVNCIAGVLGRHGGDSVKNYISGGGYMYGSDFAAGVVDRSFPGKINLLGGGPFSSTWGRSGDYVGTIVDPDMQAYLGVSTVSLQFNTGAWVVIQSVAPGVKTHIIANVSLKNGTWMTVPIIVSFPYGSGRVVYTSFHEDFQTDPMARRIFEYLIVLSLPGGGCANPTDKNLGPGTGDCTTSEICCCTAGAPPDTCDSDCITGGFASGGTCKSPASTVCCYQDYGAGGGGWLGKCLANISLCNFPVGGCITGCDWCGGASCGYACVGTAPDPSYTDVVNVTEETAHMCSGTAYPGKFVCLPDETSLGAGSCSGPYSHCCCAGTSTTTTTTSSTSSTTSTSSTSTTSTTSTLPKPPCLGSCDWNEIELHLSSGTTVTVWEYSGGDILNYTVDVSDILTPAGATIGPTADGETYILRSDGTTLTIESSMPSGSGGDNIVGVRLNDFYGTDDTYAKKVKSYVWNSLDPAADEFSVCNAVDGDLMTYSTLGAGDTSMTLKFCVSSDYCLDETINITFLYHPFDVVNITTCCLYTNITGTWGTEFIKCSTDIHNDLHNGITVYNIGRGTYMWNVYCVNELGNESYIDRSKNWTFSVCKKLPKCHFTDHSPVGDIYEKRPPVTATAEFTGATVPSFANFDITVTPPGDSSSDVTIVDPRAYLSYTPTSDLSPGVHTAYARAYSDTFIICEDMWDFQICEWVTNTTEVNGSGGLDLVFALDTTGSMLSTLDSLKSYIETQIDSFVSGGSDFRVAYVSFGDICPGGRASDTVHSWDFTADSSVMKANIADLRANWTNDGGDADESVSDALHMALNDLSWWENHTKAVVLFTDHPAKNCCAPGTSCTLWSEVSSAASQNVSLYAILVGSAYVSYYQTNMCDPTGGDAFVLSASLSLADILNATIGNLTTNYSTCDSAFSTTSTTLSGTTSSTTSSSSTTTLLSCTVSAYAPTGEVYDPFIYVTATLSFPTAAPTTASYELTLTNPTVTSTSHTLSGADAYVYYTPTTAWPIGSHTAHVRAYSGASTLCEATWNFSSCEYVANYTNGTSTGLDLVFAIDTTGSMSSTIDQVKSYVDSQIDAFVARSADFRVAYVSYGDCTCGDMDPSLCPSGADSCTQTCESRWAGYNFGGYILCGQCVHSWGFTNDSFQMKWNVADLRVNWMTAGCDIDESASNAVYAAVHNLTWDPANAKAIIIFTDAASKPYTCSPAPSSLSISQVVSEAAARSIGIYAIVSHLYDPTIQAYYQTYFTGPTGGQSFLIDAGTTLADVLNATIGGLLSNNSVCDPAFSSTSTTTTTSIPGTSTTSTTTTTTTTTTSTTTTTTISCFDWRDVAGRNYVTPVKDQGSCGSCWAFASLAAVEAKYQIEQSLSIPPNVGLDLSEQWLVSDCYTEFGGYGNCGGGRIGYATDYVKTDGVVTEGCWRYLDSDGQPCPSTCPDEPGVSVALRDWTIDSYTTAISPSVSNIKDRIRNIGPVAINLNMTATASGTVSDGVVTCSPATGVDHGVLIVGYCDNASLPSGGYFTVKNSWGASWTFGSLSSSDGYFKVAYGSCNIQSFAVNPAKVHQKTACYTQCAMAGYAGGGTCRSPASTVCCYQDYGAGGAGRCIADISLCNFNPPSGVRGCITGCDWCGTSCGYACNPSYTDVVNVAEEVAYVCPGTTYPGKYVCLPGEANIGGSPLCEGTYAHCCCEVT